jgi:protein-S-isoprenylcysteine O-methyltransferase Ste14
MELKSVLALVLLGTELVLFFGKLYVQGRKTGKSAYVMNKKGQGKTGLWQKFMGIGYYSMIVLILLQIFVPAVARPLVEIPGLSWAGLGVMLLGIVVFAAAMLQMGESWKVGVDTAAKPLLVEHGLYRFSRNPAYVGFHLLYFGFFLTFFSWLSLLIYVVFALALHIQVLAEETYLEGSLGQFYLDYKKKTPRYLFFKPSKQ